MVSPVSVVCLNLSQVLPHPIRVNVLAISGSLRARSTNTAVLEAAADLAPAELEIDIWQGSERCRFSIPTWRTDRPSNRSQASARLSGPRTPSSFAARSMPTESLAS